MRNITLICFFVAIVAIGSALECKLCVGSDKSDCYKNVQDAMVEQKCIIPPIPHHHHHHHHHHHDEATPNIQYTLSTLQPQESTTEPMNESTSDEGDDKPKIDTYCLYLTAKGNQTVVVRGCGYIHHNVDICKFIKEKNKYIDICKACANDNCN